MIPAVLIFRCWFCFESFWVLATTFTASPLLIVWSVWVIRVGLGVWIFNACTPEQKLQTTSWQLAEHSLGSMCSWAEHWVHRQSSCAHWFASPTAASAFELLSLNSRSASCLVVVPIKSLFLISPWYASLWVAPPSPAWQTAAHCIWGSPLWCDFPARVGASSSYLQWTLWIIALCLGILCPYLPVWLYIAALLPPTLRTWVWSPFLFHALELQLSFWFVPTLARQLSFVLRIGTLFLWSFPVGPLVFCTSPRRPSIGL